eukprot:8244626-Prorocentrum_lima.AAC.1
MPDDVKEIFASREELIAFLKLRTNYKTLLLKSLANMDSNEVINQKLKSLANTLGTGTGPIFEAICMMDVA